MAEEGDLPPSSAAPTGMIESRFPPPFSIPQFPAVTPSFPPPLSSHSDPLPSPSSSPSKSISAHSNFYVTRYMRNALAWVDQYVRSHMNYEQYRQLLQRKGLAREASLSQPLGPSPHVIASIRDAQEEALKYACERDLADLKRRSLLLAQQRRSRMRLSLRERFKASELLNPTKRIEGCIISKNNIDITQQIISCLLPGEWCNDEVINFYLHLLQERNKRHLQEKQSVPSVYLWNTFFYTQLIGEDPTGNQTSYDYQRVRRWTKRRNVDLFSVDLIFVPVHLHKVHWALGMVDLRQHVVYFFDSMSGGYGSDFFRNIMQYLKDEHKDKKNGAPLPHADLYRLEEERGRRGADERVNSMGVPQQANGFDCGVFVCQFCECLADGRPFDFTQQDIPDRRLKMVYQILVGRVE